MHEVNDFSSMWRGKAFILGETLIFKIHNQVIKETASQWKVFEILDGDYDSENYCRANKKLKLLILCKKLMFFLLMLNTYKTDDGTHYFLRIPSFR